MQKAKIKFGIFRGKEVIKIENKIEFVLPIKVDSKLSLNSVYSSKHWSARKRQAEQIHNIVKMELLIRRIPKNLFKKPLRVEFYWNSLLDLDNHGYVAKLIIDGLKGYLIRDDSKKYIEKITHSYWLGKGVKIIIFESEELFDDGNKK